MSITAPPVTVWQTSSYAREWLADAIAEADRLGQSARRREILFAVCAVETYVFEWTRDIVLERDFDKLIQYFPSKQKRGVKEKIKEVPKALQKDGRIHSALDCGGREFQDFCRLVDYRDGLVHARASRPDNVDLLPGDRPLPSGQDLTALPCGWASGVARALLQRLHSDTKTTMPCWLYVADGQEGE